MLLPPEAWAQPPAHRDPYARVSLYTAASVYWGYAYNPYSYLPGAADVIHAQADFLTRKGEAAYLRESTRRQQFENRRAELELVTFERDWKMDEIIHDSDRRKRVMLHRHRDPPLNEIFSGLALNTLCDELAKRQDLSPNGSVAVDPAWLAAINKTVDGRGNIGILKSGKLWWPQLLLQSEFAEKRKEIDELFAAARDDTLSLSSSRADRAETLGELTKRINGCRRFIKQQLDKSSSDPEWNDRHYVDAKRFLAHLDELVLVLDRPDAAFYLKPLEGKNVAELVTNIKKEGVRFAEANEDGQRAYFALHHALAIELDRLEGGSSSSGH